MRNFKSENQFPLDFFFKKDFTYESFISSDFNKIALTLVQSWPNWPNSKFLSIYGPKGSGKTHISKLWANKSKAKIITTIENSDIYIISKNNDAFVLDNVEPGEKWPDKLFFHFINHLIDTRKYLIITSLKPLNKFNWKLPDLNSRLSSITSTSISFPDDNSLIKIMMKQLADRQITINLENIKYILNRIERSFEEITEIIEILDHLSLSKKKPLTISLIKEALFIREKKRNIVT